MTHRDTNNDIRLFSTCPPSWALDRKDYLKQVADVSQWSEAAGCEGILIYTDNSLIDPWLVAVHVVQSTRRLSPLVAVQPVYMHPYTVAKAISSIGHLHDRRISLNMVAGGFKNDLLALNDTTPHDRRYDRVVEYTTVIMRLLSTESTIDFDGEFYKVDKLKMTPPLAAGLLPRVLLSGSSDAGVAAARSIGATAVRYPQPPDEEQTQDVWHEPIDFGIRVGLIAREDRDEAWAIAHSRFPEDRRGQLTHQVAMKVSDSEWHQQLSKVDVPEDQSPYWLVPFRNYKTFCPYLVGSYGRVAQELARYFQAGYRTLMLDVPPNADEFDHINTCVRTATEVSETTEG